MAKNTTVTSSGTSNDIKLTTTSDVGVGEYDPYLNRNYPHATSNTATLIHLLKGMVGSGVLAMPKSFLYAGYLVGSIGTILIGILLTYCFHVLLRCQYILCQRHRVPVLNYSDTMRLALEGGPPKLRRFASFAAVIVNALILLYQFGICCVYVIFFSQNLRSFVDRWYDLKLEYYILLLLLPMFALMSIRKLKALTPFSTFAVINIFLGIILIFSYLVVDMPSISSRQAVGEIQNVPLFFGTTLFALVAIGLLVALENHMKTPRSFVSNFGVLNTGMTIATVLYVLVAFLGYWKYGDKIEDVVTLNLPTGQVVTMIIHTAFLFAIFITYCLQAFVAVEILWTNWLSNHFKHKLIGEFAVRLGIVLFSFTLAYSEDQLGLFISLLGAFCLSMLAVSFPALIEICVLYPFRWGRYNYVVIRDVIIIIIGIVALVTGTAKSVNGIVNDYT